MSRKTSEQLVVQRWHWCLQSLAIVFTMPLALGKPARRSSSHSFRQCFSLRHLQQYSSAALSGQRWHVSCSSFWVVVLASEMSRRGIGKGVFAWQCPKLTLGFVTNCESAAHPLCDARNEIAADLVYNARQISQRHLSERLLLEVSDSSSAHIYCAPTNVQKPMSMKTRHEGLLALPTAHLLCMCSLLVTSEFPICEIGPQKKTAFMWFSWSLLHFREHWKVAETFWQCALSLDNVLPLGFWVWVFAQEANKMLKMTFRLCTYDGAH